MKVQIVDGWPRGNAIRILLTETDAAQVNAIRRALIADVPKLAIDSVNFDQGTHQDNKGQVFESVNVLPDETIAHRLAMIPVPTYPGEGIAFPEDCPTCKDMAEESKGCMTCQVLYHIRKEGPSEESDEEYRTVYAGDLTTISDQMFDIREEHKRIPLTILSKGQYLEFYAFATLGRGRDHAKWSPVAAVGFRQHHVATLANPKKAKILFDLDLKTTDGTQIDAKLFGKDKKLTNVNYILDLENALHQVGEGTNRDGDFDNAIVMEPVEGAYVFNYETDGSLTPEQAFNGAMKELAGRFENLSSEIERAFA